MIAHSNYQSFLPSISLFKLKPRDWQSPEVQICVSSSLIPSPSSTFLQSAYALLWMKIHPDASQNGLSWNNTTSKFIILSFYQHYYSPLRLLCSPLCLYRHRSPPWREPLGQRVYHCPSFGMCISSCWFGFFDGFYTFWLFHWSYICFYRGCVLVPSFWLLKNGRIRGY